MSIIKAIVAFFQNLNTQANQAKNVDPQAQMNQEAGNVALDPQAQNANQAAPANHAGNVANPNLATPVEEDCIDRFIKANKKIETQITELNTYLNRNDSNLSLSTESKEAISLGITLFIILFSIFTLLSLSLILLASLLGIYFDLSPVSVCLFKKFICPLSTLSMGLIAQYPPIVLHFIYGFISIPLAAVIAFIIVTFFGLLTKNMDGFNLQLGNFVNFTAQGATGPLLLWVGTFAVINFSLYKAFPSSIMQEPLPDSSHSNSVSSASTTPQDKGHSNPKVGETRIQKDEKQQKNK